MSPYWCLSGEIYDAARSQWLQNSAGLRCTGHQRDEYTARLNLGILKGVADMLLLAPFLLHNTMQTSAVAAADLPS